jgi:anti-anti-sigma regulatory factor
MSTTANTYGSMTVLAVEPALAGPEAAGFRRLAAEHVARGGRWFVVDFARAASCDSRGLEELLAFQEQIEALGGAVRVSGLKGACSTIFGLTRFDKRFELFASLQEAVRSFD